MKPEKLHLLEDLMTDDATPARQHAALHAGLQALHRRRLLRLTFRLCATAMVAAVVLLVSLRSLAPWQRSLDPPVAIGPRSVPMRTAVPVEFITDDQLLALFPGTPVGLGTAGGRTRLLFPRPGDEGRFIVGMTRPALE